MLRKGYDMSDESLDDYDYEESGWKPISEAPEMEPVLTFCPDYGMNVAILTTGTDGNMGWHISDGKNDFAMRKDPLLWKPCEGLLKKGQKKGRKLTPGNVVFIRKLPFSSKFDPYIYVVFPDETHALICLVSGNRWSDPGRIYAKGVYARDFDPDLAAGDFSDPIPNIFEASLLDLWKAQDLEDVALVQERTLLHAKKHHRGGTLLKYGKVVEVVKGYPCIIASISARKYAVISLATGGVVVGPYNKREFSLTFEDLLEDSGRDFSEYPTFNSVYEYLDAKIGGKA